MSDLRALFADDRWLWFLMRGTGEVVILLLSAATALGVLATVRAGSRWWPRWATQHLHRQLSLLALALLTAHVATAVAHQWIDVRWFDVLVPFSSPYRTLWTGLGAIAVDLLMLIAATGLARRRMRHRTWRGIHLLAYLSWAVGLAHGIGIGTDTATGWGIATTAGCVGLVAAAGVLRLAVLRHERALAAGLPPRISAAPRLSARATRPVPGPGLMPRPAAGPVASAADHVQAQR